MFEFLKRGLTTVSRVPETKALATGRVVAWSTQGRIAWTPRDVVSLTKAGCATNPVGFRAVEFIAEAAAALPIVCQGQLGTSVIMREVWPDGSFGVPLNVPLDGLTVPSLSRATPRHLRYGPAKRPLGDPSYRYKELVFDGVSLRPHPVCHLQRSEDDGDDVLRWIRQTRVGGDVWSEQDVPVAEESEQYQIEVSSAGTILRQETVSAPEWRYASSDKIADGALNYTVSVAQISARYGAGPARSLDIIGT